MAPDTMASGLCCLWSGSEPGAGAEQANPASALRANLHEQPVDILHERLGVGFAKGNTVACEGSCKAGAVDGRSP